MNSEPRVYMADIRAAKMCSGGTRKFFEIHKIDWTSFLKHGVPEQVLLETGDTMAKKVVEVARGRRK